MKKVLLLTAATMIAVSSFAQNSIKSNAGFKKVDLSMEKAEVAIGSLEAPVVKKKAPRKGLPEGLYYTRPVGTMYTGITADGKQRYISALVVPPGFDMKFYNKSTNKKQTNWTIGKDSKPADPQFVDADFNFVYGNLVTNYSGSGYYTPVLHRGTQSYQLGESNKYFAQYGPSLLAVDTITNLSFFDTMTAKNYGLGAVWYNKGQKDGINYIYGTGETEFKDGVKLKNVGVIQYIPAPAAPLYVEDYHFLVLSKDNHPIAANAKLKMVILNASEDSEGKWSLGTDTIAKLEATADDVTEVVPVGEQGKLKFGVVNINFHKKGIDPLSGSLGNVPFVVEGPHAMVITGFQDPGINVGFRGSEQLVEDSVNIQSHGIWRAANGDFREIDIYGGLSLFFSVKGGFDYIECAANVSMDGTELHDMNILRVSNDGQTISNEGKTGKQNIGGAPVFTAFPYQDQSGNFNYFVADKPDWITDVDATELDAKNSISIVKPTCNALPSGVDKRVGVVYLQGKTGKSKTPIIVLQGSATIADGIENIEADKAKVVNNGKIYNLSGQQVGKNYKGVVIKDGKKLINR